MMGDRNRWLFINSIELCLLTGNIHKGQIRDWQLKSPAVLRTVIIVLPVSSLHLNEIIQRGGNNAKQFNEKCAMKGHTFGTVSL